VLDDLVARGSVIRVANNLKKSFQNADLSLYLLTLAAKIHPDANETTSPKGNTMTVKTFGAGNAIIKTIEVETKSAGILAATAEMVADHELRSAAIMVCGCDTVWAVYRNAVGLATRDYR